ncbi:MULTISPECIES: oligopeptide/dipeptide ABC transporter ATP-binding protein [Paenibacillus]|uniref:ABC transporter ATP-binding protein n=1 Tax=Paenibacillus TaxID=44249 RepID=UPI00020D67A7|nr:MULTISPECIES: oligopeptide/dipeptide ABC transporter ATP-binding protein [Paenibacillus]EGL20239.1 ABC transporter, ATP-binding protein [Paenibacillus sp. HGF7]EPD92294.1 oligopeptide/dipeptide ABC transporter, ATP-binding protein domain [Paenibacillus sp. HGH0039]MBV6712695.1 ATP-binding cassette domain-containing protein [Paenibacillus chitinolyticus]GKS12506.1 ABC transporter ATP-binding protein [Paenibacillus chitinolyticus]
MSDQTILSIRNMKKHFDLGQGKILKAVDNFSIDIKRGETFGLVGESGCGKSTAGRTIIRLYEATDGEVIFNGENVHKLSGRKMREFHRNMQMVFQDPYASLNPRMTVGNIIAEGLDIHGVASGSKRRERVVELLDAVGLNAEHAGRFPHEFSGGQRQRIGIARALAIEPQFIIADEPISALDVSVQAQVVNLFKKLQKDRGLTYLFIAHDLAMVKHISDRIGVMYLGNLVEVTTSKELYANPLHPYTESLLSAIPIPDPEIERKRERIILKGEVPSPLNPPSGCPFRTRCPKAMDQCAVTMPPMKEVEPGHFVSCHLY